MVSWDEVYPIDQNGIITTYEVLYKPQGGVNMSMTVYTTNMSIILNNLQGFVQYNISVRAYTSIGPGPYSAEVTERTLEDGKRFIFS